MTLFSSGINMDMIMPPRLEEVIRLVAVIGDALEDESFDASPNEILSAVATVLLRLMAGVVRMGGTLEPLRPGLERLWAMLPPAAKGN